MSSLLWAHPKMPCIYTSNCTLALASTRVTHATIFSHTSAHGICKALISESIHYIIMNLTMHWFYWIFKFQPQSVGDIREDSQDMDSARGLQSEEVADVKIKPPSPKPSPFRNLSSLSSKEKEEGQEKGGGDRKEERLAKGMSKDEAFKSEFYTIDLRKSAHLLLLVPFLGWVKVYLNEYPAWSSCDWWSALEKHTSSTATQK